MCIRDRYTAIEGNAGGVVANGRRKIALVTGNRFTDTHDTHGRIHHHGVAHPLGEGNPILVQRDCLRMHK